ncbi:MAG: sensor histidine kinase [Phenylobacterium sp.]
MGVVRRLNDEHGDPGLRLRRLTETMAEGLVICQAIRSPEGRLVDYWIRDANPAYRGFAPDGAQLVGRRHLEVRPNAHPRWLTACHVALTREEPVRFELWDDVDQRWYDVRLVRLGEDELAQFFLDISDRKSSERGQSEQFDELNHRVKNNLTIVSAMLSMQARASADPQVREPLLKAVDRIATIADLHATLYLNGDRGDVAAGRYLEDLCHRLSRSLLEGRDLRLDVAAESIRLPLDEAVRLGIIANELVTNAAKHAYAPNTNGVIWVRLYRDEVGMCLTVSDVGRGIPQGAGETGLGMRLVRSLIERDGGRLTIRCEQGCHVEVRLPTGGERAGEPTQNSLL